MKGCCDKMLCINLDYRQVCVKASTLLLTQN